MIVNVTIIGKDMLKLAVMLKKCELIGDNVNIK